MGKQQWETWLLYAQYCSVLVRMTFGVLWNFLFGSLYGILVVSVLAYVSAPMLLDTQVYGVGDLLNWFSELSEGAQVATSAGVLTAVGLVAAYWTAVSAVRTQKEIELRIAAASDVQARYQVAQRYCIELCSYLSTLTEDALRAGSAATNRDKAAFLFYSNSQADQFDSLKRGLHEARMTMNGLFSAHGQSLGNTWFVFDKLQAAIAIIDAAWEACQFAPPRSDPSSRNFAADFLRSYDPQRSLLALEACERVLKEAAPLVGYVQGRLCLQAFRPGLPGLLLLLRRPRFLAPVISAAMRAKAPKPPKP